MRAALIFGAFGVAALTEAERLGVGTLTAMGPGFMPLVYGLVLSGLAGLIALRPDPHDATEAAGPSLDLRGAGCILGAAVAFIVVGRTAGLAPAAFVSVLVAALGDRTTRLSTAIGLAATITVFGCLLFGTVLRIPIPLLRGVHY